MRISTNNIPVNTAETTKKYPVKDTGTVLLLPTQVNKYLGSYIKHKMIGMGIFLNPGYIINVVESEKIGDIYWLLVIYNNRYYYTPMEYVDVNTVYGSVYPIAEDDTDKINIASESNYYKEYNAIGEIDKYGVDVYDNPATYVQAKRLGRLESGEEVRIVGKLFGYYKLYSPSKYRNGYIISGNVKIIDDTVGPPKEEDPSNPPEEDNPDNNLSQNNGEYFKTSQFGVNNFELCYSKKNITMYNEPSTDGSVMNTIQEGNYFVIQSVWYNSTIRKNFFGSSTYSPNSGSYGLYDTNLFDKVKVDYKYSMVECEKLQRSAMNNTVIDYIPRGTINNVLYQDWSKGKHVMVTKGKDYGNGNVGLYTVQYGAAYSSPLADSKDMFREKWHGTLTIDSDATVFAMHRYDNTVIREKFMYLKDISYKSLSESASKYTDIYNVIKYSFGDTQLPAGYSNPVGVLANAEVVHPSDTLIAVNKITIKNDTCWICYKHSNATNGAIYFIVLHDNGKHIKFEKFPEVVIDDMYPATDDPLLNDAATSTSKLDLSGEFEQTTWDPNYYDDESNSDDLSGDFDRNPDSVWPMTLGPGDTGDPSKIPDIDFGAPQTPPEYVGWPITYSAENFELKNEKDYDHKHITHINRFKIQSPTGALTTKSFIFVTRPDLNLYTDNPDGTVNTNAMNPDLKMLATFKYIARLRGNDSNQRLGNNIMNSLCYYQLQNPGTPWLSILTNQARGYSPIDREMDTVALAETFHGNKIIYAEPTYKYKIAGTVSIPFEERRDLSLYLTLRMWIEYIQMVSIGQCSPRKCHRDRFELDYAASLYYIVTDETMENILYWEKLTGLIPLTVPDQFFEWSEGTGARNMKYNVNFAYSFRTVMDELHLAEINNLYFSMNNLYAPNATGMPAVPPNKFEYVWDMNYNENLARVAAFYGHLASGDDEVSKSKLEEARSTQWIMDKYYYGGIPNIAKKDAKGEYPNSVVNEGLEGYDGSDSAHIVKGSTDGVAGGQARAKFLPNYNIFTHSHGIPYVTGPYIEHNPDLQRYILRWV